MLNLTNPTVVRGLMQRHGVQFNKALGQNFLINPTVCPWIAQLGGAGPEVGALEIGPGVGVLTAELARCCRKVVAVELDRRLVSLLGESLAEYNNVQVIQGDILKTDVAALLREQFGDLPVVVCANLPYYITSPILMHLLEADLPVQSYTFLVQREMAERLCTELPSRQAGAITAAVQWRTRPRLLFRVAPGSFLPPPKVESAVIRLDVRQESPAPVHSQETLFAVVKAAFGQRRKTLRNSLGALGLDKEQLSALFQQANVDPGLRAEQLDLAAFARLANAVAPLQDRP